ncbi:MAG: acylphosphatase [Acidobacteria bacterium]|nr:acylphosphatase [Acidobacteriota bacterium]
MAARRFLVKGRVQGVGFRYFVVQAAWRCGVVGTVRNLPTGAVEVIAEGALDKLAALRLELAQGPAFSRVTTVEEQEMQATHRYTDFEISY